MSDTDAHDLARQHARRVAEEKRKGMTPVLVVVYLVVAIVGSILLGRRLRAMRRRYEEFERFWRELDQKGGEPSVTDRVDGK